MAVSILWTPQCWSVLEFCLRLEDHSGMAEDCKKLSVKLEYQQHAFTLITLFGKHRCSSKENLFDVIKSMQEAYIVDNNFPSWEKISALPQTAKTAFILGTTIDKERPLPLSLFEGPNGIKVRPNVFHFGMKTPAADDFPIVGKAPLLLIQRLDEHSFDFLDRARMLKWQRTGKPWNDSRSVNEDKEKVLGLLNVRTAEDLNGLTFEEREARNADLHASLQTQLSKCFKDFMKSIEVARYAYVCFLLHKPSARHEFASGKRNVLGDMQIIQNALFWNAKILSKDADVHHMAQNCRIRCLRALCF